MIRSGQMVLKGIYRLHNDKMGQMILKGVNLVHNVEIRAYGVERSHLGTQSRIQVIWS